MEKKIKNSSSANKNPSSASKNSSSAGVVAVFGASGFLGRHVIRDLTSHSYRVRAGCRSPAASSYLSLNGEVGQVDLFGFKIEDDASIHRLIDGADYVINLVGNLYEHYKGEFEKSHHIFTRKLATISCEYNVKRIVHISSISCGSSSVKSSYSTSKLRGELALKENFADNVILRSSLMFGPEDNFFNKFASMCRFSPFLPLIGEGKTLFDPVYVCDVASAICSVLDGSAHEGLIYELGGPERLSFRRLMELLLVWIDKKRLLVPVPYFLAHRIAFFSELLPNPVLTRDQLILLNYDNIVSDLAKSEHRTISDLGITASSLGLIVPDYLTMYRTRGNFSRTSP